MCQILGFIPSTGKEKKKEKWEEMERERRGGKGKGDENENSHPQNCCLASSPQKKAPFSF
jgi:hypothetical protein